MVNQVAELDRVFQALSDTSRRDMLARLVKGPASVSELARPFEMSLPAVMQHLTVLEDAGLINTVKVGRVRTCQVEPDAIRSAEGWLTNARLAWERRLDRLGELLATPPDPQGEST